MKNRSVRPSKRQSRYRRSSPGLYCRYSVNSVEKPVNGERCKPDMNPSTTARASNSREPILANSSGSKNLAGVASVAEGAMTGDDFGSSLLLFQKLEDFPYIIFHFSFFIFTTQLLLNGFTDTFLNTKWKMRNGK